MLHVHWFRARLMICLSFILVGGRVIVHVRRVIARRLPCGRHAVPRRLFTNLETNQLCICVSETRVRTIRVRR